MCCYLSVYCMKNMQAGCHDVLIVCVCVCVRARLGVLLCVLVKSYK